MTLTPEEVQKLFAKKKREVHEDAFEAQLLSRRIPYEKQYDFGGIDDEGKVRHWRFDFALLEHKIGVEIDGGTWLTKGGHTTGSGYQNDREKDRADILLGWRVLRFSSQDVKRLAALNTVQTLIKEEEHE